MSDDLYRKKAEQAFDIEKAEFSLWDRDYEPITEDLDDDLNEQLFKAAMEEMVKYLFERRRDYQDNYDEDVSLGILLDPDNVSVIYISARGLAAPQICVDYDETPEWFTMENAALREFYWHPKPALSGQWTAGFFQPR